MLRNKDIIFVRSGTSETTLVNKKIQGRRGIHSHNRDLSPTLDKREDAHAVEEILELVVENKEDSISTSSSDDEVASPEEFLNINIGDDNMSSSSSSSSKSLVEKTSSNANDDMINSSSSSDEENKENEALNAKVEELCAGRTKNQKSGFSRNYFLIYLSIIPLLLVTLVHYFPTTSGTMAFDLNKEIIKVSKQFPNQAEDVWRRLIVGINRTFTTNDIESNARGEPAIFLLAHWTKEIDDVNDVAYRISEAVGSVVLKYKADSNDVMPLTILRPDVVNKLQHGDIITDYAESLRSSHVMIVHQFQRIIPDVVQGLRYYCDEFNPVVSEAIIFLTMNMEECNISSDKEEIMDCKRCLTSEIEKCLENLWSGENGLESEVIKPLLVRTVNIVLPIREET